MKHPRIQTLGLTVLAAAGLTLSGCATGGAAYVPIIDGPKDERHAQDLSQCQKLAETREYTNSDVATDALIGAGVGGLVTLSNNNNRYNRRSRYRRYNNNNNDNDLENFAAGAVVGALLGGGARALRTRKERKYIVLDCMAGRGHRVLG